MRRRNYSWPQILLNILGAILLLGFGSEIFFHRIINAESRLAIICYWLLASIPAISFIALRAIDFKKNLWIRRWWPAFGIGFLIAVAMIAIVVIAIVFVSY